MADGVVPTENDLDIARSGVMLQFESLSIEDFIENTIKVIATDRAYIRMLCNALNQEIIDGKPRA
jgi:hypothetical protein